MIRYFEIGILALASVSGCTRTDTAVRVWRPGDHDQTSEPAPAEQSVTSPEKATTASSGDKPDARTVWMSLCSGCHGEIGEGNGPVGLTVGARNLADPRWQASTSDEQMARAIVHGKGRMPAFSLKPDVVQALVRLIRRQSAK